MTETAAKFRLCKKEYFLSGIGLIKCLCRVPGKDLKPHYNSWWCPDGGHESTRNRYLFQCPKFYTEGLIGLGALTADAVYKECITEALLAWLLWSLQNHSELGTNRRAKEWVRLPGYLDESTWVGQIKALAMKWKVPLAPMESVHADFLALHEMMKRSVRAAKPFDQVRSDRNRREGGGRGGRGGLAAAC